MVLYSLKFWDNFNKVSNYNTRISGSITSKQSWIVLRQLLTLFVTFYTVSKNFSDFLKSCLILSKMSIWLQILYFLSFQSFWQQLCSHFSASIWSVLKLFWFVLNSDGFTSFYQITGVFGAKNLDFLPVAFSTWKTRSDWVAVKLLYLSLRHRCTVSNLPNFLSIYDFGSYTTMINVLVQQCLWLARD